MSKVIILGDICFGRDLSDIDGPYISSEVAELLENNFVIANLENPIVDVEDKNLDHLQFQGRSEKLKDFKFVDVWGLANNHINDLGAAGIASTVKILNDNGIEHCGLKPLSAHFENEEFVIFFFADMMNYQIPQGSKYDVINVFSDEAEKYLEDNINPDKKNILYAHTGLLFCGEPSKKIRERLRYLTSLGLDAILTCHSHTMGPMEEVGSATIHYSLGDFLMDGKSVRRRKSKGIQMEVVGSELKLSQINFINDDYFVDITEHLERSKSSFWFRLPLERYYSLFNLIYRINLFHHVLSTFIFLIKNKGVRQFFRIVWLRRQEVLRFFSWLKADQRTKSDNYDAISVDRVKHQRENL